MGRRHRYTRPPFSIFTTRAKGRPISYTSALVAVLAGIVHAGLAPAIVVADVKPSLLLVAVVLVTCVLGFEAGILWAFIAGLVANLLIPEPLGSIPLAMLLVAAFVAGGSRILGRLVWVYPVFAAFAGSILADVVSLSVARLIGSPLSDGMPVELILPAAALNAAICGLLLYPVRMLAIRYWLDEKPAW
jgi:rod shape-determining protein MreD